MVSRCQLKFSTQQPFSASLDSSLIMLHHGSFRALKSGMGVREWVSTMPSWNSKCSECFGGLACQCWNGNIPGLETQRKGTSINDDPSCRLYSGAVSCLMQWGNAVGGSAPRWIRQAFWLSLHGRLTAIDFVLSCSPSGRDPGEEQPRLPLHHCQSGENQQTFSSSRRAVALNVWRCGEIALKHVTYKRHLMFVYIY